MNKKIFEKKLSNCENETLSYFFFQNALRVPDKKAFEWFDEEKGKVVGISYDELFRDITGLGTALYGLSYRKKTIALIGDRSYEWVLSFLTMVCSNAIVVPMDPKLETKELIERIKFSDAQVCIADDTLKLWSSGDLPGNLKMHKMSEIMDMTAGGLEEVLRGNEEWISDPICNKQQVVMMFTSGTGGKNKAALIRQENFTLERYVWSGLEMENNTCLITLPLYHIAGIGDLRGTLLVGTTAYLSSGLRHLLKEYAYARPRIGFMVPAQAMLLYEVLSGKDKEEARALIGGNFSAIRATGAPLPDKIREMFKSYDIKVTSDYGMTETCGPVSVSMVKDGEIFSKEGSVGHIIDCLDVFVENPDENGCGEIVISGQCVFDGYYKDPEQTQAILRDGKLYTGDIGRIDEDRFLFIVGRKKNVIILSSGENVIPEELENMIYKVPEVKECLVFQKDDAIVAKVYCGSEADAEKVESDIKLLNKKLPSYKQIRSILLQDTPLEKTSSGKIRRA